MSTNDNNDQPPISETNEEYVVTYLSENESEPDSIDESSVKSEEDAPDDFGDEEMDSHSESNSHGDSTPPSSVLYSFWTIAPMGTQTHDDNANKIGTPPNTGP